MTQEMRFHFAIDDLAGTMHQTVRDGPFHAALVYTVMLSSGSGHGQHSSLLSSI